MTFIQTNTVSLTNLNKETQLIICKMEIVKSLTDIEQLILKQAYKGINTVTISTPQQLNLESLKKAFKTLTIKEKGLSQKNKILRLHWTENIYSLSPIENDEWY